MNNSTNKPTILITGSEGSLAQWIISYLKDDYNIIGIDNCLRYGVADVNRNYNFLQLDLNDLLSLQNLFDSHSIDYVLHCAAQIYGVKGFHIYSADIISNNTVSTSNLLKVCTKQNVKKVIYISSSMVYENATSFPLSEEMTDTIAMPSTGYGLSKLIGERMLKEYNSQYGLNYVVWRPFNIITPYERSDSEPGISHVFADFIQKIIINKDKEIEIFGNGEQIRCFTWIDDIAKIIANASFLSITDGETYNVGSESPTKIIDLAKMIFKASDRTDEFCAKFVDIYQDDVKYRVPSSSKAQKIGWRHTKTLEELVNICVNGIVDV